MVSYAPAPEFDLKVPLEGSKKRENWALLPHGDAILSATEAPLDNETTSPVAAGDAENRADGEIETRSVLLPKKDPEAAKLPVALTEEHTETVAERLRGAEGVEAADSEPLTVTAALTVGEAKPVGVADDPPPAEKRTTSPVYALRRYEKSKSESPEL